LFYAFFEILRIKKPKYFLLENVAQMPAEAMEEISSKLGCKARLINSSLFTAQNRPRAFWFNWEMGEIIDRQKVLKRGDVLVHAWSKSLRAKQEFNERIRINGKANCLTATNTGTDSLNFFPDVPMYDFPSRVVPLKDMLFIHRVKPHWRLTANEREELQGFPMNWTAGVLESARNHALGNAVTVDVIEHILKGLRI
jgi:site-specific DNA-cytosine methylase